MIVATGASEGHAEEGLADFCDLGVDVIRLHFGFVGVHDFDVSDHEEAGGDDIFGMILGGFWGEQVARDLFADELVERFIGVERVDEVIAVAPSVFGVDGVGSAHHVGIPGEVEPVAGPAFSVGRIGEQAIDDGFEGFVRAIVFERANLVFGGGESGQIERDASEPRVAGGVGGGADALFFLGGPDEGVEGVCGPGGIGEGWGCWVLDGFESPKGFSRDEIDGGFIFFGF